MAMKITISATIRCSHCNRLIKYSEDPAGDRTPVQTIIVHKAALEEVAANFFKRSGWADKSEADIWGCPKHT